MKKLLLLVSVLTFALVLTACAKEEEVKEIPAEVTMETVDEYMNRDDVQYVDLRNFEDKMASGYIAGFEFIPFFNYLEYEEILVRTDKDWEFASEDIVNQTKLENFFDKDKTIFLMCGSGTRAGFVMAALEELGYENVINVGGIKDYTGMYKVNGDESYNLDVDPKGPYTPGTYYGYEAGYSAVVVIGPAGAVEGAFLDAMHCKDLLNAAGEAYATDEATDGIKESCFMKQSYTAAEYPMNYDFATGAAKLNDDGTSKLLWAEQADALAAAVVAANGWSADWSIDLSTDGGHDYFTDGQDAVAGVTLGIENWKVAVEEALAAAMGN